MCKISEIDTMITEDEAFWAGMAVAVMMLGGGFSLLFLQPLTGYGAVVLALGLMTMALTMQMRAKPIEEVEDFDKFRNRVLTPTPPIETAKETPTTQSPPQPSQAETKTEKPPSTEPTEHKENVEPAKVEPTTPTEQPKTEPQQPPQPTQPSQPQAPVEQKPEPPKPEEKPKEEPQVVAPAAT